MCVGYACVSTLRAHKKDVTGLAVSPDGQYAVTVSRDTTLKAAMLCVETVVTSVGTGMGLAHAEGVDGR